MNKQRQHQTSMTIIIVMMLKKVGHPNIDDIEDDDFNKHIEVHDDDDNKYYSCMKVIVKL